MADGKMIIDPAEARAKAMRMDTIATQIEELLNNISKEIDLIDNVESGVYQGNRNPAQLKADLAAFRSKFNLTYGQVRKSAKDIIEIANAKENI
ncbi:MAG: hypothetical protein PUC82_03460 [bacterium]|nr:hypothetical protein [bacterium]